MKKSMVLALLLNMLILGTACSTDNANEPPYEQQNPENNNDLGEPVFVATPNDFKREISNAGTLESVEYMTNGVSKTSFVYLPYQYDSSKKYDILYLIHGGGGNNITMLGNTTNPTVLKHVIDNLIGRNLLQPMIIVVPSFYTQGTSQSEDPVQFQNDAVRAFQQELRNDLIPAVESVYSTYAVSTNPEDLIASRVHRSISGFSMGGTTTWYALIENLDYFHTFVPVSGDCWAIEAWGGRTKPQETAELIAQRIKEQKYTTHDFYVFAITGTEDAAYEPLNGQISEMKKLTDTFTYDHDISKGNLYYLEVQGGRHNYEWVTDYLYVLLPYLFGEK